MNSRGLEQPKRSSRHLTDSLQRLTALFRGQEIVKELAFIPDLVCDCKVVKKKPLHSVPRTPLNPPSSADRKTRYELAVAINEALRQQGLSQLAAAAVLHMPQPKISALMNYRLEGFSVQRLFRILNALGRDVVIQIASKKRPGRSGKTSVNAA